MATNNILQQVQTYNMANLAFLQNLNCFIGTANTKFKDFQNIPGNLGPTVTYELPPRFTVNDSLVATFQDVEQRVRSLTVDRAKNVAYAFSAQQFIFNVEDYMKRFGMGAMKELSTYIEADVARLAVEVPYRFYGNGTSVIPNTYTQIAKALTYDRNYGAADGLKVYIPDTVENEIISSGLNQFVLDRNERDAQSWEIGNYNQASFYRSNLLPVHYSGTVGNAGTTLTVVSISADGTQITFSGASNSDNDAVKEGDLFQFQDGVSGQSNIRFLTFIGHKPSASPVQFRATANAASTGGGQVTVTVTPALISDPGRNQNLTTPIVAGMQVKALPDFRAGLVVGGDALYLAMPELPDEDPYKTAVETDPDTKVSLRTYYGSLFGQNQRGMVNDCIWGRDAPPEYTFALIYPATLY